MLLPIILRKHKCMICSKQSYISELLELNGLKMILLRKLDIMLTQHFLGRMQSQKFYLIQNYQYLHKQVIESKLLQLANKAFSQFRKNPYVLLFAVSATCP
ncbi:hypothetical protein SAMN02927903_03340 [Flavobacterium caeni]|uniref:Uncharacterized protein n=1 Tax=Flavobacterium caeni TaxID=490189 RepID=A0A1G5KJZ8_9FLAO|nr:hypothetical protein SAMN02927903_03340 [Flavobacterium caeni]